MNERTKDNTKAPEDQISNTIGKKFNVFLI